MNDVLNISDCLQFLQNRLDDFNRRLQVLVSILGILPVSYIASVSQLLPGPLYTYVFLAIVAGLSILIAYLLQGTIVTRRGLLLVIELVIDGILVTPPDVSAAYHAIRGEA